MDIISSIHISNMETHGDNLSAILVRSSQENENSISKNIDDGYHNNTMLNSSYTHNEQNDFSCSYEVNVNDGHNGDEENITTTCNDELKTEENLLINQEQCYNKISDNIDCDENLIICISREETSKSLCSTNICELSNNKIECIICSTELSDISKKEGVLSSDGSAMVAPKSDHYNADTEHNNVSVYENDDEQAIELLVKATNHVNPKPGEEDKVDSSIEPLSSTVISLTENSLETLSNSVKLTKNICLSTCENDKKGSLEVNEHTSKVPNNAANQLEKESINKVASTSFSHETLKAKGMTSKENFLATPSDDKFYPLVDKKNAVDSLTSITEKSSYNDGKELVIIDNNDKVSIVQKDGKVPDICDQSCIKVNVNINNNINGEIAQYVYDVNINNTLKIMHDSKDNFKTTEPTGIVSTNNKNSNNKNKQNTCDNNTVICSKHKEAIKVTAIISDTTDILHDIGDHTNDNNDKVTREKLQLFSHVTEQRQECNFTSLYERKCNAFINDNTCEPDSSFVDKHGPFKICKVQNSNDSEVEIKPEITAQAPVSQLIVTDEHKSNGNIEVRLGKVTEENEKVGSDETNENIGKHNSLSSINQITVSSDAGKTLDEEIASININMPRETVKTNSDYDTLNTALHNNHEDSPISCCHLSTTKENMINNVKTSGVHYHKSLVTSSDVTQLNEGTDRLLRTNNEFCTDYINNNLISVEQNLEVLWNSGSVESSVCPQEDTVITLTNKNVHDTSVVKNEDNINIDLFTASEVQKKTKSHLDVVKQNENETSVSIRDTTVPELIKGNTDVYKLPYNGKGKDDSLTVHSIDKNNTRDVASPKTGHDRWDTLSSSSTGSDTTGISPMFGFTNNNYNENKDVIIANSNDEQCEKTNGVESVFIKEEKDKFVTNTGFSSPNKETNFCSDDELEVAIRKYENFTNDGITQTDPLNISYLYEKRVSLKRKFPSFLVDNEYEVEQNHKRTRTMVLNTDISCAADDFNDNYQDSDETDEMETDGFEDEDNECIEDYEVICQVKNSGRHSVSEQKIIINCNKNSSPKEVAEQTVPVTLLPETNENKSLRRVPIRVGLSRLARPKKPLHCVTSALPTED